MEQICLKCENLTKHKLIKDDLTRALQLKNCSKCIFQTFLQCERMQKIRKLGKLRIRPEKIKKDIF